MLINKTYKFRLYPTKEQQNIIIKTFGCSRFIYNYYLDMKQKLYKEKGITLSKHDMCKDLKVLSNEKPFLKEVDSMALRNSIFDLYNSYESFFKENKGYPKYKKKYGKNSYRTNLIEIINSDLKEIDKKIDNLYKQIKRNLVAIKPNRKNPRSKTRTANKHRTNHRNSF